MYLKHVYTEEKKQALDKANTNLSHANSYFDSHHNAQSMEYYLNAQSAFREIQDDPMFPATDPEIAAFLNEFPGKLQQFKDRFDDRVVTTEFKDQSSSALQNLSNAESYFKNQAYSQALEYLQQAKLSAAQVLSNTAFTYPALAPQLASFREEFTQRAQHFQTTYDETILDNEIRNATSTTIQLLKNAQSYFESHHSAQALEYFNQARDKKEEIETNLSWFEKQLSTMNTFLAQFDELAKKFQAEHAEREFNKELHEAESQVNDNLSHAHSYFDSHRTGQALEYYRAGIEALGALRSETKFRGIPRVESFIETAVRKADEFQEKFTAREFADRLKAAQDLVSMNLSHAKTYYASHRRGQALEYLHAARNALQDYHADDSLMRHQSSETFVEEMRSGIDQFEEEYAQVEFKEEINAAISGVRQQLDFARSALSTDTPRTLGCLDNSRRLLCDLGFDLKFYNNVIVQQFISEFTPQLGDV